jgi:hypothetical protein
MTEKSTFLGFMAKSVKAEDTSKMNPWPKFIEKHTVPPPVPERVMEGAEKIIVGVDYGTTYTGTAKNPISLRRIAATTNVLHRN